MNLSPFGSVVTGSFLTIAMAMMGCAADSNPNPNEMVPMSDLISPTCVDGQYSEALPTGEESVADITYDPTDLAGSALRYLDRRYPNGALIVSGCLEHETESRCVDSWLGGTPATSSQFMLRLSTVVHEAGHLFDLASDGSGFGTYYYTDDTILSCEDGDSVPRGGETFARSEIYADEFQSTFPGCASLTDNNCDSYALIYLNPASPVGTLGPSQGFSSVIEEATQYVNSLATGFVFRDQIAGSRSERDGILAFLWYIERYLHLARLQHPDAYAFISGSACWREVILTVWGRAWLYLEHTEGLSELEVDADIFMNAVRNPVLVDEIARIRAAHGCS